jgi:fermentation-respiration switch protein FrsA (DUF1100 family)
MVPGRHAFVALMVLLGVGCSGAFFLPDRDTVVPPGLERLARVDAWFASSDNVRLHGWRLSPKDGAPPKGAILFLHGNAGDVGENVGSIAWLAEAGYVVLAFDYRGYGLSGGEPSFEGVHDDARAALDALRGMPGVDPRRIAVIGQSLGGAIAIHTVATLPDRSAVRALVADAAFADYRLIVRDRMTGYPLAWLTKYPASWLYDDRFSPERVVSAVAPVPLVLIHGTADDVVPYRHAGILYAKAREPKALWTVEGGGHAVGLSDARIRARLLEFLEGALR